MPFNDFILFVIVSLVANVVANFLYQGFRKPGIRSWPSAVERSFFQENFAATLILILYVTKFS